MPVMLSIGHVSDAPDTRALHDSRWLSVTVVYEVMTRNAAGTPALLWCMDLLLFRMQDIVLHAAMMQTYSAELNWGPGSSPSLTRSLRIPYMLSSKVIGRAGRRRGYGRRGHDGRAQPRAVWAMPRPVERPPASDGAVVAREARIRLSLSVTFGATQNGSRRKAVGARVVLRFKRAVRSTYPRRNRERDSANGTTRARGTRDRSAQCTPTPTAALPWCSVTAPHASPRA